jgi:hypothetical protein
MDYYFVAICTNSWSDRTQSMVAHLQSAKLTELLCIKSMDYCTDAISTTSQSEYSQYS